MIDPLQIEQASAHFDEDARIVYVTYRGSLGEAVNVQVYDWLDRLLKSVDLKTVYGEIFDFQKVSEFQTDNLEAARKSSKRVNLKRNVSQLPVALVVGNAYQHQILEIAMRVTPDHQRKRIVRSQAEALTFLEEWNKANREPAG